MLIEEEQLSPNRSSSLPLIFLKGMEENVSPKNFKEIKPNSLKYL